MDIETWWPKLSDETRRWLREHPRARLSADVLIDVTQAGGTAVFVQWTSAPDQSEGYQLTSQEWDYISRQSDR